MVGNGHTVKSAVIEMKMVAEGMTGAKGIFEMNKKFKVDIPSLMLCTEFYMSACLQCWK